MRVIFKIARAEFRNLFYSPVAWFVVLVFYIFCALLYHFTQERFTLMQEVFLESQPDWMGFDSLSNTLFSQVMPVYLRYTYMFIPLLTMGLVSREVNSGTIKFLYSSPIRSREIVLGKYVGMMLFNCILLLSMVIVLLLASFSIKDAEHNWHLSMFLGLFLLISAYTAIGLFISCLTSYQIVAAVITFAVFFILSNTSGLLQQYDFIRDITWSFSIAGRADRMIGGLITSREVIYFFVIIFMFLGFALVRIRSTQESKKWTVAFSRYTLVFLVGCMLGYASSRPGYIAYYDAMKNKTNTLYPAVQAELARLDGSPVTVTLYTNLLNRYAVAGLPQGRNPYIWRLWEKFIRFYPNLHFKYEYYYGVMDGDSSWYKRYPGKTLREIAAIEAEVMGIRTSLFKEADDLPEIAALKKEGLKLIMQLEYHGKKEWLRTYEDGSVWPDQPHVGAAIKRLTRTKEVRVGFLTGHYERDPNRHTSRDYGAHINLKDQRKALVNHGVDTDTLSAIAHVPASIDLLVMADPKSNYSQTELDHIDHYLQQGGNAILYAEPNKKEVMQPLLNKIGIHIDDGIIVKPDAHEMPHIHKNRLSTEGNWMAKEKAMEYFQLYHTASARVTNEGAANISYVAVNGFKVEPVIIQKGSKDTWIENGVLVVDSATPVFNPLEKDLQKDMYTIAVKLTRKINNKEQRIVVTADADFMSQRRMATTGLGLGFYSWGLNNEYPIYTNYKLSKDRLFLISNKTAKAMLRIFVYGIPALLLLSAIILLVRRKRK